jgi:hypothetical protein
LPRIAILEDVMASETFMARVTLMTSETFMTSEILYAEIFAQLAWRNEFSEARHGVDMG